MKNTQNQSTELEKIIDHQVELSGQSLQPIELSPPSFPQHRIDAEDAKVATITAAFLLGAAIVSLRVFSLYC